MAWLGLPEPDSAASPGPCEDVVTETFLCSGLDAVTFCPLPYTTIAASSMSSHNQDVTSPSEHELLQTPVMRAWQEEDRLPSLSLRESRRSGRGGAADLTTSAKNVILTEAGRSPWYSKEGVPQSAYVIGVAGGQ